MKLEMSDTPGQLVRALKPVSDTGGNIIAVIHQREERREKKDIISVQIVVELPEGRLEELLARMRDQGVSIQRLGTQRLLHRRSLIMIGHIMHTDLTDTVDRIDKTGFAEVSELEMIMPAISEPSSARITIRATSAESMDRAVEVLREVAREKDILVIEPLGEES
ncbi:MAG: amino acid-binding protein [Methanomicrobiales archaeon]|nr:amino acid-binding protein [Methanomicrobiales archaeon]